MASKCSDIAIKPDTPVKPRVPPKNPEEKNKTRFWITTAVLSFFVIIIIILGGYLWYKGAFENVPFNFAYESRGTAEPHPSLMFRNWASGNSGNVELP